MLSLSACSQELPARWIEPTTKMEFVLLPAGDFVAGSPTTEAGHQEDETLYPVQVATPFYMATHEVTRAAVGRHDDAGRGRSTADADAAGRQRHLERGAAVSRSAERRAGRRGFACPRKWSGSTRAAPGTTTPYSTGEFLSTERGELQRRLSAARAGRRRESRPRRRRSGRLRRIPGACSTCTATCGSGPTTAYDEPRKVIRGGSWRFNADSARCALRYHHRPAGSRRQPRACGWSAT